MTESTATVVGYDASAAARAALTRAAARLGPDGRLIVVAIAHVPVEYLDTNYHDESVRHARERAQELLDGVGDLLPSGGPTLDAQVHDGPPAATLAELARSEGARDIAIGARGLGRIGAAALGSTSHALLHETDRPVLVMTAAAAEREERRLATGGNDDHATTVVVGYDGSEQSQAALRFAAERAGKQGRVVAVNAYEPPSDWLGGKTYKRAADEHQEHGRRLLAELEAAWAGAAMLETDLLEGPPAKALVHAAQARHADEIVVGARGLGRFRAALGSVSHALLHEADRPLVVIPA